MARATSLGDVGTHGTMLSAHETKWERNSDAETALSLGTSVP